jgi:hypothetical protein
LSIWNGSVVKPFGSCHDGTQRWTMQEKPTQKQLDELKRLSKEARVPDQSEIVTSRDEAERRIRDLKEKARIE